MIKPAMFIGFILLAVLTFAVFQVEHKVLSLRSELREVNRQLVEDKESIHVLNAEWSYVNRPKQLKIMADKYLGLDYINVSQVRNIEEIPLRPVMVSNADGN